MVHADFEGIAQLDDFTKTIGDVREVVLSVSGDTRTKQVGTYFVAQPIVRIRCEASVRDKGSNDPLATKSIVWEVVEEPTTGQQEYDAVERIRRALRARGFAVATPARAAY